MTEITAFIGATYLTPDCHQSFDGVVVHVDVMGLRWSIIVSRCKVRPADSRSATCTELDHNRKQGSDSD